MEIRFPISAKAKNFMILSVALNGFFGNFALRLKEYVGFSHISSITCS